MFNSISQDLLNLAKFISVVKTASPKIGILGSSTFSRQNATRKFDMEPTNTVGN
jgi:hypothetical protein